MTTTNEHQTITEAHPIHRREVFALDEGEVTVYVPAAPLSRISLQELIDHFELIVLKIERRSTPGSMAPGFSTIESEAEEQGLKPDFTTMGVQGGTS